MMDRRIMMKLKNSTIWPVVLMTSAILHSLLQFYFTSYSVYSGSPTMLSSITLFNNSCLKIKEWKVQAWNCLIVLVHHLLIKLEDKRFTISQIQPKTLLHPVNQHMMMILVSLKQNLLRSLDKTIKPTITSQIMNKRWDRNLLQMIQLKTWEMQDWRRWDEGNSNNSEQSFRLQKSSKILLRARP
jgi:hypothetical protein